MKRIAIMLIAAAPAVAAIAQAPAGHGLFDNVVNQPGIGWAVYGANQTARQVAATGEVPGGQAVRFTVSKPGKHPYDVGATYASSKPIAKGDTMVAMVFLRAPDATADAPLSIPIGISAADAPYTPIADTTVQVGPTWKRYFAAGVSPQAFAPGKARIAIQLGGGKQVIELGSAFLLDPGPGFDTAKLPRN